VKSSLDLKMYPLAPFITRAPNDQIMLMSIIGPGEVYENALEDMKKGIFPW
jgi:hypothetical protein